MFFLLFTQKMRWELSKICLLNSNLMCFLAVYSNVFLNQRSSRYEYYYELDLRLTEKTQTLKWFSYN